MVLKKIVLDIVPYIDRLHNLLYKNKNSYLVDNINKGIFTFSPGVRCPLNYLKEYRPDIKVQSKYESKLPYLSFIGYEALELYITHQLTIIGMTEDTAHLYNTNPVLEKLGFSYSKFLGESDINLLTTVIDLEKLYGMVSGDDIRAISDLERHLSIYLSKLAPYVADKICSVDLKLETPILTIKKDIRDFRIEEAESSITEIEEDKYDERMARGLGLY